MKEHGVEARGTNRIRSIAVGLAAAGAVSVAGCSSHDGLTQAQLAAKADAACVAFNQGAATIPFSKDPSVAAKSLDQLIALGNTKQWSDLKSLKPDGAAKQIWDRYLAASGHVGTLMAQAAAKAHAGDQAGLIALQDAMNSYIQSNVNPIASELGANMCS
jgi:hypothetical protein